MFSIIIPLYNKANYITKTIQCVLKQTVQSFEIIIVNDSSTDNSLNIVSNIQDERITIYTKPNGGVSSARNYGIKKAKFDYIVFLDADDLWEEDFLSSINQLIQRYPQAGMYCTGFNKIINISAATVIPLLSLNFFLTLTYLSHLFYHYISKNSISHF